MSNSPPDDHLARDVSRALAARRPVPSRDLEMRLRAAAHQPRRRTVLWPIGLGIAVTAAAAFVLAQHRREEERSAPAEPSAAVAERAAAVHDGERVGDVAPGPSLPAGGGGAAIAPGVPVPAVPPVPATAPAIAGEDPLAPYQALLDQIVAGEPPARPLTTGQLDELRAIALTVTRQQALLGAQLQVAQLELEQALEDDALDPARAARLLDRVNAAENAIRRARLVAGLTARAVLDPGDRTADSTRRRPPRLRSRPGVPAPIAIAPPAPVPEVAPVPAIAPPAPVPEVAPTPAVAPTPGTPAPAASTTSAVVDLTTDPPGANVYADGKRIGRSPISLRLPAGEHDLRIELPGYARKTVRFKVLSGRALSFQISLAPSAASH